MLTFGSLFAGIGGIDLGLERAGMTCRWQVEIDDHATKVLAKHWPDVARFRDVRDCGRHNLEQVDLIAGGFPCQDISNAGRRAGIDGDRSGLWSEFARVLGELRPRYALVENVAALLGRGIGRVLGDLAAIGYDAEWYCIPAAAVGAPHIRDRVFILAYAHQPAQLVSWDEANAKPPQGYAWLEHIGSRGGQSVVQSRADVADASCDRVEESTRQNGQPNRGGELSGGLVIDRGGEVLADTDSQPPVRIAEPREECRNRSTEPGVGRAFDGISRGLDGGGERIIVTRPAVSDAWSEGWEDGVSRVARDVPHRTDRLRGLGNAVVPQVVEYIGMQIVRFESASREKA